MIVAFQHVWLSLGRTDHGRNVMVPFSAREMTVKARGTLHAAKPTTNHRSPRRKTIDTICGKRAYPVIINVDDAHAIVPPWPVPTRFGLGDRCQGCVDAAQRQRPDVMFRGVEIDPTDDTWRQGNDGG